MSWNGYGASRFPFMSVAELPNRHLHGVLLSVKVLMASLSMVFVLALLEASFLQLGISDRQAMANGLPDFARVVEQRSQAVVKIDIRPENEVKTLRWKHQPHAPDYFSPNNPAMAIGSGFVISENGYVLTSYHVVEEAQSIRVRLKDDRSFPAQIIGRDQQSDLALLKIDAEGLEFLTFASAEDIRVGQWVMAIGSPYGLDFSASVGIISALRRNLPKNMDDHADDDASSVPYIQTDVAINPGNSGGPLFNTRGQVIGVNSQIFTRHGGSIGLSFAVPSYVAVDVVEQLKKKGRVSRGWLGVTLEALKNTVLPLGKKPVALHEGKMLAEDIPSNGVIVSHVEVGSPAKLAGLLAGDLIVSYNNERVSQPEQLANLVSGTQPGARVPLELIRKGHLMRLHAKISIKNER